MAVRFDAAGDRLEITTGLPDELNLTFMAWFKITVDRNAETSFFHIGPSGSFGMELMTAADGTTLRILESGGADAAGSALTVGAWNHIALTRGANGTNSINVYLNGTLDITATGTQNFTPAQMQISDRAGGLGDFLNGAVEAVKIFNAALTQPQIAAEKDCYQPQIISSLYGFWPFLRHEYTRDQYGSNRVWTPQGTLATEAGPGTIANCGAVEYGGLSRMRARLNPMAIHEYA